MRDKHLKRSEAEERVLLKNLAKDLMYDPSSGLFWWTRRMSRRVKAGNLAGSSSDLGRGQGYLTFAYKNKKVRAHRLAWFIHYGEVPTACIDHKNGNRLDNSINNLRVIPGALNAQNRKEHRNGVLWGTQYHWRMKNLPYHSRIKIRGKYKSFGYYATREEAHRVSLKVAKENGIAIL
jgi:hypothetical protein